MCGAIAALASGRRALSYQLGRLAGYSLLGFLFGAFGKVFFDWMDKDPAWTVGAFLFVFLFLFFQVVSSWSGTFDLGPLGHLLGKIHNRFFSRLTRGLLRRQSGFLLGLGNALLPCGFFIYFGSVAASTGSPLRGVGIFVMLWLGSLPALFAASFGFQRIRSKISTPLGQGVFFAVVFGIGLFALSSRLQHSQSAFHAYRNGESFAPICGSDPKRQ